MTASAVGYHRGEHGSRPCLGGRMLVVPTLAWAVLGLLVAQRATPAALVDGPAVGPGSRESPPHPGRPSAADLARPRW